MFSTDIMAANERYGNDVAENVMEKAKRMSKDHLQDVSELFLFYQGHSCHLIFILEFDVVSFESMLRWRLE